MKMRGNILGEAGGTTVRMLEGGERYFLLEDLSDSVGKCNDLIELASGSGDVVGNIEGASEVESACDGLDFTLDGKRDRLVRGGNGIHP
jgi:hypothetical protein